jgi:hypothetical protein
MCNFCADGTGLCCDLNESEILRRQKNLFKAFNSKIFNKCYDIFYDSIVNGERIHPEIFPKK